MHHRHRPRRPSRRPRLRPAREIQTETASGGRITGAQQRASRPAPTATRQPASHHRGARHLRDLAAAATHPQRNRPARAAGLDRGSGTPPGHQLRPPPLQRRPRPQPPPPPPGGNTRRGMRLSALPPRRSPLRLRAHHCLGRRRRHVRVQCRASLPSSSPPEAAPQLASGAVPARLPHLDHPRRPPIHHRTHHLPDLTPGAGGVGALGVGDLRTTTGTGTGTRTRTGTPGPRPGRTRGGPGSGRHGAAGHGLGRATPSSARRYLRRAAGLTRIPANPVSAPPQAEQSRAMQVALPPGQPSSGRSLH